MATSIHTPSGNWNTVSKNINPYPYKSIKTTEIKEHTQSPNGYINTVPINLTRMLSDNLNACAINKYTNMVDGNNHIVAIW